MNFLQKSILFALPLVLVFGEEAFDYCSLNDNVCEGTMHIACGTLETKLDKIFAAIVKANITTAELSDSDKVAFLNFMNAQRNKIALGKTPLPKTSNLPKTVWDDELELFAKSLAEIQAVVDDATNFCFKRRDGKTVYSNLIRHQVNPRTVEEAIRGIFDDPDNNVDNEVSVDGLKEIAYLSKMGCSFGHVAVLLPTEGDKVLFQGGIVCVLDYSGVKREDVIRLLYDEGEPCSKCQNDLGCDTDFAGLCATK